MMTTSSFIFLISLAILPRVATPSDFKVDLSKSNKVSAWRVIFFCATLLAGAAAGLAAAAGFGASQPSQFAAAVAGVQVASRQHNVPSPFLQGVPVELTQLSTFFG